MEAKSLFSSAVFIFASGFISSNAMAGPLSGHNPDDVCKLLGSHGMQAHEWRSDEYPDGDYTHECNSQYKELDNGKPMPNNIAYYVTGSNNSVSNAKLILNVNDKSKSKAVRAVLMKETEFLAERLGGITLPKGIKDAILTGSSANFQEKNLSLTVEKTDWPRGNGYEVHVSFAENQ